MLLIVAGNSRTQRKTSRKEIHTISLPNSLHLSQSGDLTFSQEGRVRLITSLFAAPKTRRDLSVNCLLRSTSKGHSSIRLRTHPFRDNDLKMQRSFRHRDGHYSPLLEGLVAAETLRITRCAFIRSSSRTPSETKSQNNANVKLSLPEVSVECRENSVDRRPSGHGGEMWSFIRATPQRQNSSADATCFSDNLALDLINKGI